MINIYVGCINVSGRHWKTWTAANEHRQTGLGDFQIFTYLDPYPPGMTLLFGSFCCDQTISRHKLKLTDHALCSALPFRNHYQEQQPRCRCHGSFRFDCRMVCMWSWIKVSHFFQSQVNPLQKRPAWEFSMVNVGHVPMTFMGSVSNVIAGRHWTRWTFRPPLDFSLENLRQHPRNEVKQLDETLEFLDSTKQPKKNDKMILLICYWNILLRLVLQSRPVGVNYQQGWTKLLDGFNIISPL